MTIVEIKNILAGEPSKEQLELLLADTRSGVKKLVESYYKRQASKLAEQERFRKMLSYENKYWAQGYTTIAGCDEAGRGPLAGPLVVAAVILPQPIFIEGLNDSKKVSAKKRDSLYTEICQKAVSITVNIVGPKEIDSLNIYEATKVAMKKCLENLTPRPEVILLDAMPVKLEGAQSLSLIHGDSLSASIAAASIIAKVTRDRIMLELDKKFPQYGFAGHKGYGSESHMQAIKKYGPCQWHRRSYEPIKTINKKQALGEGVEENILQKIK